MPLDPTHINLPMNVPLDRYGRPMQSNYDPSFGGLKKNINSPIVTKPAFTPPPPPAGPPTMMQQIQKSQAAGINPFSGASYAGMAPAATGYSDAYVKNANAGDAAHMSDGGSTGYVPTWQEMAGVQDAYGKGGLGWMDPRIQDLQKKLGNLNDFNKYVNMYSYNPSSFAGYNAANPGQTATGVRTTSDANGPLTNPVNTPTNVNNPLGTGVYKPPLPTTDQNRQIGDTPLNFGGIGGNNPNTPTAMQNGFNSFQTPTKSLFGG